MTFRSGLKRVFSIVLSSIMVAFSANLPVVAAEVGERTFIDKFSANRIMFYDPEDCDGNGSGSNTTLAGNDTPEKMWNYLIGKGFSDAQAAGILGNSYVESYAFNVAAASNNSYWGLFQFNWGYNPGLRTKLEAEGLDKYIDVATYGGPGGDDSIPDADKDRLIQIEMDYMMENNAEGWQDIIKKKAGDAHEPEYAAEVFLVHFERAINGSDALVYYTDDPIYHGSMLYQGASGRRDHAREMYDKYAGSGTPTSGVGGVSVTDGSNVTWIGDSLTAIWKSTLETLLPSAEIYAESGKAFNHDEPSGSGDKSGMNILSELKSGSGVRDILVFALGTNDWSVTTDQINTVIDDATSAGAKIVVLMTAYTTSSDYDDDAHNHFNTNVKNAADSKSNVLLADWHSVVSGKASELLGSDGVHEKDEAAAKTYFETFINTINSNTTAMTADECCDPKDGTGGSSELWDGTKYLLTDGQINGIAAMANNENGGSVDSIKTEVSLMANLFEKNHASDAGDGDALITYIKDGGWFASSTGAAYNESYDNAAYSAATKDVLVNGNRTLPPEVIEHDCFYGGACTAGIGSAFNDGVEIDMSDKSQFKRGVTVLKQQGFSDNAEYIFWDWADPKAQTGDPFGYYESNPPKGNSNKGSSSNACCDYEGSAVTTTVEGHTYAFPLVSATQSNYLQPNSSDDGAGQSVLSGLPCPGFNCHHDYHALDMGIRMEMVSGSKATEYGGTDSDMMYYSAGASVAAFTDGKVTHAGEYHNGVDESWWDKCGQISIDGDDGNHYWLGHLDLSAITVSAGDTVKAGDIIAKVGAPQCAQGTQSHLHIDNYNGTNAKSDTWTIEVMNQLWEKLSGSDSGSGVVTCNNTGDLPAGGMTLEEAAEFMKIYANLPDPQVDDPWQIKANDFPDSCGTLTNCVEFSLYFIHRYTKARFPSGLPDGGAVVSTLISSGQGFTDGGHTPKLYAIFSTATHTGVVLGIDKDNDKIIIGEAGCPHWPAQANEYSLSTWSQSPYTYAYTDGILGGGMNAE